MFLIQLFPVVCSGYLLSVSLYLYIVPLAIVVALLAIYFLMDKSKKKFAFKREALKNEIRQLKKHNETLADELIFLTAKLKVGETQWSKWDEEKQLLIQKIEKLENQIEKLNKSEIAEKEDIIIEYYVNEKYGD